MEPSVLPEDLKMKCWSLVRLLHQAHGLDALPQKATSGGYMVVTSMMPDTRAVMRANTRFFKLETVSWGAVVLFTVVSVVWSWWLLIGSVSGVIAARWLANQERAGWVYLGAALLGLEVLATDFCGWGSTYPDLRKNAIFLLDDESRNTTWLDYYLPGRAEMSPALLREFGPSQPR